MGIVYCDHILCVSFAGRIDCIVSRIASELLYSGKLIIDVELCIECYELEILSSSSIFCNLGIYVNYYAYKLSAKLSTVY